MRSGVAMVTSKSSMPPSICAARSSDPTMSAPASRAAVAASPAANTATRTSLPVPAGRPTVPRTIWSALRGSTPSRATSSTVSSKLALGSERTSSTASGGVCSRSRSKRFNASLYFLPCAMVAPSCGRGGRARWSRSSRWSGLGRWSGLDRAISIASRSWHFVPGRSGHAGPSGRLRRPRCPSSGRCRRPAAWRTRGRRR